MDRSEIEARARGEARSRDELAQLRALRAEVEALEGRAGWPTRIAAALAGSRVAGLRDYRGMPARGSSAAERTSAALRRRRFRLSRRRRVLSRGLSGLRAQRPPPRGRARPRRARKTADFCIRIAGRDWDAARLGGDAALARSLARALEERGARTVVQLSAEEDASVDAAVELTLRGRPTGEPTPGRLNLLWLISHPEEATAAELERYDRVLVASRRHAAELAPTLQAPVEPLLQFTDPRLFHPDPGGAPAHDLLFVGNWRGEFRRIVWDALQTDRSPALYGQGWDLLAPEHAVAEHVPHAELRHLYSACRVLLCDHWDDMRRHGFVSNKVFDALACGAFTIADENPALAEELPGGVETYATATELGEKIDHYLERPAERERFAERGRELVLAEHTVDHRAERLLAIAGDRPADGASAAAAGPRAAGAGQG